MEVQGDPGLLTDFESNHATEVINFTVVEGGHDGTTLAIKLPKLSNVLQASMNLTGTDALLTDQIMTYGSRADFERGKMNDVTYNSSGLHLDMEGTHPFWSGVNRATGNRPVNVSMGDFDNDGRDDFVTTDADSDRVTIWYQDSMGNMSINATFSTPPKPSALDTGDYNNDGRDDFVIGFNGSSTIRLFFQKASGGFSVTSLSIGAIVGAIATGDLNNDGKDDMVMTSGRKHIKTFLQGLTGFTLGQTLLSEGNNTNPYANLDVRDVDVSDLNGDGRDDVLVSSCGASPGNYDNSYYGRIRILRQDFTGNLSYQSYLRAGTGTWYVTAGDVSGDGKPEIVYSANYINKTKIFYQDRAHNWPLYWVSLNTSERVGQLAIADFDGDQKNDLVGITEKPSLIFYGQRNGKILDSPRHFPLPTGATGAGVAAGDFNNDGNIDAVTANEASNNVTIFLQRSIFDGTYISDGIVTPAPVRDVTFTYDIVANGGGTDFYYSVDNGTNWNTLDYGAKYDLVNRTSVLRFKIMFHSTNATMYDAVESLTIDMTYQSYPSDLALDVGDDGTVEWQFMGELDGTVRVSGWEDEITTYVRDPDNFPDAEGMVTVPLGIGSTSMGDLAISDLHILYNNASDPPVTISPIDGSYANATPIFRFFANDSNDDQLYYILQITNTDFDDIYNTKTFDMRYSLFNETPGEGFSQANFRQGTIAIFTLPRIYGLDHDTVFKWRVRASDGHLLSNPSEVGSFKVDGVAPTTQLVSPQYSWTRTFNVSWAGEDPLPGSGLAVEGTYDVQYRTGTDPTWVKWLMGIDETYGMFTGDEGVNYHFRARAWDTALNAGPFSDGIANTSVDTLSPVLEVETPTPGYHVIDGSIELRVRAHDNGFDLPMGVVFYNLDALGWGNLTIIPDDSWRWNLIIDTSSMKDGEHIVGIQITDPAGHVTEETVHFFVDNTDPICVIMTPSNGDVLRDTVVIMVNATDILGIEEFVLDLKGIPGMVDGESIHKATSGDLVITVDTTMMDEEEGTMRAMAIDKSGRSSLWTDIVRFEIDNLGPRIEVSAPPTDGFLTGIAATVRVKVTDAHFDIDNAVVNVQIDGGDWYPMFRIGDVFEFMWDLGTVEDGGYELTVVAYDQMGNPGREILSVKVDNDSPSVSVREPTPGQTLTGKTLVLVETGDEYLDKVSARIDEGEWGEVSKGLFTFETEDFSDGEHILYVKAVDEVGHETVLDLAILFDNSPPVVVISEPMDGSEHRSGTEVVFGSNGTYDAISLDDLRFAWTSSLDGPMGTEADFTTNDLSEGTHTIRLTVTDPVGLKTYAEVEISVTSESPWKLSDDISTIIILVIVLVCVVGMIVYFWRIRDYH